MLHQEPQPGRHVYRRPDDAYTHAQGHYDRDRVTPMIDISAFMTRPRTVAQIAEHFNMTRNCVWRQLQKSKYRVVGKDGNFQLWGEVK